MSTLRLSFGYVALKLSLDTLENVSMNAVEMLFVLCLKCQLIGYRQHV